MARKVKVDPVVAECYRLKRLRDPDEKRRGYIALYQEHLQDKIDDADINHVEAIIDLGCRIAIEDENYQDAIHGLDAYFSHPGVEQMDFILNASHRNDLFYCLLLVGEHSRALEIGRSLVDMELPSARRIGLHLIQGALFAYVANANPADLASEELTDLISDFSHSSKRHHALRKLPTRATFRELTHALITTFPKEVQAKILESQGTSGDR